MLGFICRENIKADSSTNAFIKKIQKYNEVPLFSEGKNSNPKGPAVLTEEGVGNIDK